MTDPGAGSGADSEAAEVVPAAQAAAEGGGTEGGVGAEGSVGAESGVGAESTAESTGTAMADGGRARAVLAYLAANLVDDTEAVVIDTTPGRNGGTKLTLRVGAGDMGKVIGRRGRIAQSIRSIVRAAAAVDGQDAAVDIAD